MGRVQAMIVGAAVALALPLAAAGCGGGDDGAAAPTPKGFDRTETADFSLALPSKWQVDKRDAGAAEFLEARPPGSDINRAQVRIGADRGYRADINGAVLQVEGEIPVRRPGATRVMSKPVEVRGAADARRVEWTVPAGGGLEPARIVTVLALSSKRTLVNLSLGVAQSQLGDTPVDDVVRSLQVK
jgi:hypothetical protein